ncbi:M4 family metallopeptidase [Nocardioides sp. GXZ039]|uniref:M4 family metallopeptidase n=1 Tax=Nocardioides sp. GXZ039 TaxID=3136018 RepID=UPI0030F39790
MGTALMVVPAAPSAGAVAPGAERAGAPARGPSGAPAASAEDGAATGPLDALTRTRTPALTDDRAAVPGARSAAAAARTYLAEREQRFGIAAGRDLVAVRPAVADAAGRTAERFAQRYHGIPVLGAEYVVRVREHGGRFQVEGTSGDYFTGLRVDLRRRMPFAAARGVARQLLAAEPAAQVRDVIDRGEVVVPQGPGVLTRHVTVVGLDRERGLPLRRELYLAAGRTVPVLAYDDIQTDGPVSTTGAGFHGPAMPLELDQVGDRYDFRDLSRGQTPGATEILTYDADGGDIDRFATDLPAGTPLVASDAIPVPESVNGAGAVDAHWGAAKVYDFYRGLGRDSLDGRGGAIRSVVNVTSGGRPYANAFWNGRTMVYGTGGDGFRPFAAALDVVGHEMTHGVVDHTSDLIYIGQSGALNEALADYFGNAIENETLQIPAGPDDGLLGEDLCGDTAPRDCALRDLRSLMTTLELRRTSNDNGGVHLNSPIASGALWEVRAGLGAEVADPIVYDVMTNYLTPLSQFIDLRDSVLAAAAQHGVSAGDLDRIREAFTRHGIFPRWENRLGGVDASTLVTPMLSVNGLAMRGDRWIGDAIDLQDFVSTLQTGRIGRPGSREIAPRRPDVDYGPASLDQTGATWFASMARSGGGFTVKLQHRKAGGARIRTLADLGGAYIWGIDTDAGNVAWLQSLPDWRNGIWVRTTDGRIRQIPVAPGRSLVDPEISGRYVYYGDGPAGSDQEAVAKLRRYDLRTGRTKTLATVRPQRDSTAYVLRPQVVGKYLYFLADAQFRLRTSLRRMPLAGGRVRTLIRENSEQAVLGNHINIGRRLAAWENLLSIDDPGKVLVMDLTSRRIGRLSCSVGDQTMPVPGRGDAVAWIDATSTTPRLVSRPKPRWTCPAE